MVQKKSAPKKPIEAYQHADQQRANNPPVGLVTPQTDPDAGKSKTYAHDPHLAPQIQWAGKAEHTSFEVPTRSLHVHERIEPRTLIEALKKRNGNGGAQQGWLFDTPAENPPLREALAFYQHKHGWSNRLIAGDSLLVMSSLLEKEGLGGKVQTIYIDPPYGIKYGSNFQPFVNQRDVKDGKDEDLTAEPEQIRAFRDTWELGIHSYLSYLRDRLLLARELLTESGSVFVQISDENVHRVRMIMDEVFGAENFVSQLSFRTKIPLRTTLIANVHDYILWYARSKDHLRFYKLYTQKGIGDEGRFNLLEMKDGSRRHMTRGEKTKRTSIPAGAKPFVAENLNSAGRTKSCVFDFEYEGRLFRPTKEKSWKTNSDGMRGLARAKRLFPSKNNLYYVLFHADYPVQETSNIWNDTRGEMEKNYVVQTADTVIQRCLLMTTDPGDLVFDPTCGSGTTAYVAERWGRRWITCDTSRVALTLARQRLMTAMFDYYELAYPDEGVGSGFKYKTVPHITLKSIAHNSDIKEGMTQAQIDAAIARYASNETLYDQPRIDTQKKRVSGPFTIEAVPAPVVKSVDDLLGQSVQVPADASIARSGETLRQSEWRDELLRTGIRGKNGQYLRFARLEPLAGCRYLHADGELRPNDEGADSVKEAAPHYHPQRIVVSFGPPYAPLEQRQVEHAWKEALTLAQPRLPSLLVFAAFQFDPEAAKDIDELKPAQTGMQLLKVQMNADLLTDDLKKKRASNQSFWLIGQPEVQLERIAEGEDKGKWRVQVQGFDYYNTKTGGIESGDEKQIAVWLLDPDYDGRSLYPRQVFFPQAGVKGGWARLAKNLKAEIDEDLIAAYRGTVSLPFEAGAHRCIAVKIVDDRGIESLRVMEIEQC